MDKSGTQRPERPSILIADDHEMIAEMFALCLMRDHDYDVRTVRDLEGAVDLIGSAATFDAILLDWNMPGMHGVNGLRRMIGLARGAPVAIVTGEPTEKLVEEAMSAGAAGVVPKSLGLRTLVAALSIFISGEKYLPFSLAAADLAARQSSNNVLTRREMLVLQEIAKGKRNREICTDLALALPTVKMHVSAICRKLQAKNRLHAVVIARDLDLV